MGNTSLIIILLALPVVAGLAWYRHRRWLAARHQAGLQWCGLLLDLVMRVQQHRGLATGWLSGDASFHDAMLPRRQEIEQLLNQIAALPREGDPMLIDIATRELPAFIARWQGLCGNLPQLAPFASMTRHTALIGTLMTWLRSIGERCLAGGTSGHPELADVVPVFVDRLPALSEALGQLRAVGCAAVAIGELSGSERERLSYLMHRANELLGRTEAALGAAGILAAPDLALGMSQLKLKTQELLDLLCNEILDRPRIVMAMRPYFVAATQAIDEVFVLLSQLRQCFEHDSPSNRIAQPRPATKGHIFE